MYTPASFNVGDSEAVYDFMERNSFAILCSHTNGVTSATHLPMLIDRSAGCLYGHMAKANLQWKEMNHDVLVVFHGPHAYISPSWYETDQAVPTWNYAAVHITGEFTLIDDQNGLLSILEKTVSLFESGMRQPWEMSRLAPELLNNLSAAIVGFRIDILQVEGKWKLSQNHSNERRQRVIRALEAEKDDRSRGIADLMKGTLVQK